MGNTNLRRLDIPKYIWALAKQTLLTSSPINLISSGNSSRSTCPPSRLQRIRRKYSCRGKDINERESVVMPTNLESKPKLASVFRCSVMPCFWSRNHHGGPHCNAPV